MIFSHATENNQQGSLLWASSVAKSVQSIDVFKIGNDFQAVVSMINILKPADNTAILLIIPIKKDATSYNIPASLESIELERYIACSDSLKTSRRLIVVACSLRGYIQVWDIASKEMIIEDMMAAQRVPYEDIQLSIVEHDFENLADSIDPNQLRHCSQSDQVCQCLQNDKIVMGMRNTDGNLDQSKNFYMSMASERLCTPDQFGIDAVEFLSF